MEAAGFKEAVEGILAQNDEFSAGARCLQAMVEVSTPSGNENFVIDRGAIGGHEAPARAARVRMAVTAQGWQLLQDPCAVNITLNRLFREGHIEFGDDLHDVMHHWSALFWLTAAMRESLSGVREV